MQVGRKTRVGLVLSAIWLCLVLFVADDDRRIGQVLGLGFLPLVILWGIIWAFAGWRTQRPLAPAMPEALALEAKRKGSHRIRTFICVVAVLIIGLFAAAWQLSAANIEAAAGGKAVESWFGEWAVYGLFAYAALRFLPRPVAGFAAVLAALMVVGGVNYKTHAEISEDRQSRASLAKAAPLINKIQSGAPVSDQEIKDTQIGVMEPLILAQAGNTREALAIAATYTKAVSDLQPDLMLTATSLVSPNIRAQTRAKLKVWQQAIADYTSQFDAAAARGRLRHQAARSQVPAAMAAGASKGFEDSSVQARGNVNALVSSENEAIRTFTAILDLMDANSGSYGLDKGPPANLWFRDEATLARYRQLTDAVTALGQRELDAQAERVKVQSARTNRLNDLLKR